MTTPDPPPVWDGQGIDPWLPARLAAFTEIVAAEQAIRAELWPAMAEWLVAVRRGVLAAIRPDPLAVYAHTPAWTAAVKQVVTGPLRDTIGEPYRVLLGETYVFDQRPAVVEHLASAANRLAAVPDEVHSTIVAQVARGASEGEAIPEIATRVNDVLDTSHTPHWPNRATVIARTETLGALNSGRADAFTAVADELEQPFEQQWLATLDGRVRRTHAAADGQRVAVGTSFEIGGAYLRYPGDPLGPGKEVIQCLRGDVLVDYRSIRAVTRRWYEGEMVELCFAGGDNLAVTPNHPILRADGQWIPAGLLDEGCYCIRGRFRGELVGQPHEHGGPAKVAELYRAASQSEAAQRVYLTPPDFHGDATDGDVDVVPVYGYLRFDGEAATDEEIEQFGLALADLARAAERGAHGGPLAILGPRGEVDRPGSPAGVRGGCEPAPLGRGRALHADRVGLTAAPDRQVERLEVTHDDGAGHPEHAGHCSDAGASAVLAEDGGLIEVNAAVGEHRLVRGAQHHISAAQPDVDGAGTRPVGPSQGRGTFPGFVETAKLVGIKRYSFTGHVYNLDTGVGWYTGNGITVRNCRCTTLLMEPGEDVDLTYRQMIKT